MNMVGKSIRPALIILSAAVLLGLLAVLHSVPLAQTPSGLVAYRVIGSANLANPGSESFWNNIPWFNVTLSPTLSGVPTSGLVPYVEAKAAYNGDYIFILVKWPDNNPSTIGADAVAGPGHWIMVYNPKGPLNMTFLDLLTSTFHRHYK
jgi:Ethylbenzene dehydrogenase.